MKKVKDIIPFGTETRFINCLRRYFRDELLINYSTDETYELTIEQLKEIDMRVFTNMRGVGLTTGIKLRSLEKELQIFDQRNFDRLHNKNK